MGESKSSFNLTGGQTKKPAFETVANKQSQEELYDEGDDTPDAN